MFASEKQCKNKLEKLFVNFWLPTFKYLFYQEAKLERVTKAALFQNAYLICEETTQKSRMKLI